MIADHIVQQMHAEYMAGASLDVVARKHGRNRHSVRELFQRRKLPMRPPRGMLKCDRTTGRFIAAVPLTEAQIAALIAKETKVRVPPELKLEWRSWSLERRGDFIRRLRAKVASPDDRPNLPFSANVQPFDYTTPAAREIVARMNAGRDSRNAVIKLDVCSEGVIWEGRLWFWNRKIGGYFSGPWIEGIGRPLLHREIWKRHHGTNVPDGHVVRFLDGNPNNLVPENLTLATRNDLARENQAAALLRKSRAATAILLQQTQTKAKSSHANIATITKLKR